MEAPSVTSLCVSYGRVSDADLASILPLPHHGLSLPLIAFVVALTTMLLLDIQQTNFRCRHGHWGVRSASFKNSPRPDFKMLLFVPVAALTNCAAQREDHFIVLKLRE